jgi:hypothetical protein
MAKAGLNKEKQQALANLYSVDLKMRIKER